MHMNSWEDYDEQERYWEFQQKARKEAEESYPEGEEKQHCPVCGQLLVYRSMSYYEGYHFDSCD